MRRLRSSIALLTIFLAVNLAPGKSSEKTPHFEISQPTVIAFFPSNAKANSKTDDMSESLSDFQLYAESARQQFQKVGVDLEVVYARSFRVVADSKAVTFHPAKAEPGYYFAAPNKKPRIEYGVMTDAEILRVAQEYFGLVVK